MVIWKYKSDGTLDTTFDEDGIVVFDEDYVLGDERSISGGNAISLDDTGKIYVTGHGKHPAEGEQGMVTWKYK